jgi:hypothetical protein
MNGNDNEDSPSKNDLSLCSKTNSELDKSTTNSEVYDKELFEGLTSKQKKNLRKKL